MAMAASLPLFSALLLALLSAASATATGGGDAHDVLAKHGLPRGLVPRSVKSFSLSGDGEFVVELTAPCYVQFTDLVYYEKKIKGKLSYGEISDLSGIQAKKLFVWVPISGIVAHRAAGTVEFKVGFLSETFPETDFELIPDCRARAGCRGGAGGFLPEEELPTAEVAAF